MAESAAAAQRATRRAAAVAEQGRSGIALIRCVCARRFVYPVSYCFLTIATNQHRRRSTDLHRTH
jgi:hypothetical protein